MESNDINKLLSKNKTSNNEVIRLSTIIKSNDKKSLFNSNFFSIIKQNKILFPINPNKNNKRLRTANVNKRNDFIKMKSNINIKPNNLFKNEDSHLLKEQNYEK